MQILRRTLSLLVICSSLCSCGLGAGKGLDPPQEQKPPGQAGGKKVDEKKPRAPVDPNKFAVVIAGAGGEEAYTKQFSLQANQLHDALVNRLGFDEKRVFLLTEKGAGGPENGAAEYVARSTAQEARKAFETIKAAANPESLVFVILMGHGSFDGQQAKFNLVGPDLSAKEFLSLVSPIPARRVIFVNCASASGEFVKPLSGANRVVITATRSGSEQNATVFAEHFINGLTEPSADADKNNRISVLEAFNFATKTTADWYKMNERLASEHALLDDNGDGVGHEEAKEGDGAVAKTTYLDSNAVAVAGTDADLARLLSEKQKAEEAIEKLKVRKGEMKPEEYERELERLLVDLATITQSIKAKQK
ncbi:MAG TPA: hypothetical protein VE262_19225 [Blastocatellia bacterium]|nr:hypothetical protein [Blastocatellia bacterium]